MSATMARQGGWVQLEQSAMHLALNMAKKANGGFSRATTEEIRYLIYRPLVEVLKEKKWGVEFPGHVKVNGVIQRHLAMLPQNQTNGCLPGQNGTKKISQRCRRPNGTGAPLPGPHRQLTPEPTPSMPEWPPAPPGDSEEAQRSQIDNLPPRYVYSYAPLPLAQFFNLDAYGRDSQNDTDYNQEMLTDEGTSTG